eukprot:2582545-Pyramimonas_sp.AAC.1
MSTALSDTSTAATSTAPCRPASSTVASWSGAPTGPIEGQKKPPRDVRQAGGPVAPAAGRPHLDGHP